MKDRINMIIIRLTITVYLLRNFRKWGRWRVVGMTEEEKQKWLGLLNKIRKKYGYEVEVAYFGSAK